VLIFPLDEPAGRYEGAARLRKTLCLAAASRKRAEEVLSLSLSLPLSLVLRQFQDKRADGSRFSLIDRSPSIQQALVSFNRSRKGERERERELDFVVRIDGYFLRKSHFTSPLSSSNAPWNRIRLRSISDLSLPLFGCFPAKQVHADTAAKARLGFLQRLRKE
jgi:hypothetical protein